MVRRKQLGRRWQAVWLLLACTPMLFAQGNGHTSPPHEASSHPSPPLGSGFRGTGAHLPQWFAQHQNLAPSEQANALRREPGFTHLPEGQQQQLVNRLHRLDTLPPVKRQREMERNERFQALSPERQQEVRGASQTLGQMPPDRREAVRQAFRDLRSLPPGDRGNALGSARFQAEYTPQERSVLSNLLSIEPGAAQQR